MIGISILVSREWPCDLIGVILMAYYLEPKGYLKFAELSQRKIQCIENLRCVQWFGAYFSSWAFSDSFPEPGTVQSLNNNAPNFQPRPFQGKATVVGGQEIPKKDDAYTGIKIDEN